MTGCDMSSSKHKEDFKQICAVTILDRDSEKQTDGFAIDLLENSWQMFSDLTSINSHLCIIWVCLYMYIYTNRHKISA